MTRIAALDLGSNSFHLLVADALRGGRIRRVATEKVKLRLAENIARDGALGEDAAKRIIATVGDLLKIAKDEGAKEVVAVATSALREATDGPEIVADLQKEFGFRVHVLSGEEEATLSLLAISAAIDAGSDEGVIGLDLGGGSYEVAYGASGRLTETVAVSLPLGAARIAALQATDPPRMGERAELHARALELLMPMAEKVAALHGGDRPPRAAGTAGTIRDLGRIGVALSTGGEPPDKVRGMVVTRAQLERAVALLVSRATRDRMDIPGVSNKRADLLPAGGIVVLATMEAFGLEHLQLCHWGLREGALLDVLGDATIVETTDISDLR